VCKSWIWISRSQTGRCKGVPLGWEWKETVGDSNCQVARSRFVLFVVLCMWVAVQVRASDVDLYGSKNWFRVGATTELTFSLPPTLYAV